MCVCIYLLIFIIIMKGLGYSYEVALFKNIECLVLGIVSV